MNRLKGKTILITGASSGIGKASAFAFANMECHLVLTARRENRLNEVVEKLKMDGKALSVKSLIYDVRDRNQVEKACAEILSSGNIDILLNNAGLASGKEVLHEGDYEDWEKMIDTNVKGLLYMTRNILPSMVERNTGHVVNIGSTAGHFVYPGGNVYNATKFAVRALTQGINQDLFGTNVRVSSIDPAITHTEFSEVRYHGDKDKAEKVYQGFRPLQAEDVADAVLYVCNAPDHVNILDIVMYPTDQRSAAKINKKS